MLDYENVLNRTRDIIQVKVYCGRLRLGSIEKEVGGWRYYPKGKSVGGDLFPSIVAVKKSLESD